MNKPLPKVTMTASLLEFPIAGDAVSMIPSRMMMTRLPTSILSLFSRPRSKTGAPGYEAMMSFHLNLCKQLG